VTEAEWDSSTDPRAMLSLLRTTNYGSSRKYRLAAAATCRLLGHVFTDEHDQAAIRAAEVLADRQESKQERTAALWQMSDIGVGPVHLAARLAAGPLAHHASSALRWIAEADNQEMVGAAELMTLATLLRDLFGNPFRFLPPLDPTVLAWQDATVVRLAQAAYDGRQLPAGTLEPERLAVLADALEEAGYSDKDLLGHLREQGAVHVRGCWCIDLLLARSGGTP
jgi:hypothetical protein